MVNSMKIEYENDRELICIGSSKYDIKYWRGIEPIDFVRIYNSITDKYSFEINDSFFRQFQQEKTAFGRKGLFPYASFPDIVDFFMCSNTMHEIGMDLNILIKELLSSSDVPDLRHARSLAYLGSIYSSKGHSIEYHKRSKSKSADLSIDGISADLKVIQENDWGHLHYYVHRKNVFVEEMGKSLCYDIGKAIANRLFDAIYQAEMVFIDLSLKSLSWLYRDERFDGVANIVPQPQRNRIIYFCTIPPDGHTRRYLDYLFYGFFADFDPNVWAYVRDYNFKIENRMHGRQLG